MKNDNFGDRMKSYEAIEAQRILIPRLPIYVRLDGKNFSKFTRKMKKPYDIAMSETMMALTEFLVDKTSANIGYTQSDEISLCWYYPNPQSQPLFGGRVQKICSILAGMASAKFYELAIKNIPDHLNILPSFDCRVFSLPNITECANAFLWREQDASRNAISMLAQSHFSHKQLQGKSCGEMLKMLEDKKVFMSDQPTFFSRGSFIQRKLVLKEALNPITLEKITVERHVIQRLNMPNFTLVKNREQVIFENEDFVM